MILIDLKSPFQILIFYWKVKKYFIIWSFQKIQMTLFVPTFSSHLISIFFKNISIISMKIIYYCWLKASYCLLKETNQVKTFNIFMLNDGKIKTPSFVQKLYFTQFTKNDKHLFFYTIFRVWFLPIRYCFWNNWFERSVLRSW